MGLQRQIFCAYGARWYLGAPRDLGPDGDQVLLEQPLLVGDLVGVAWLLLVLLHLLAGKVQHTLQLVLEEGQGGAVDRSVEARQTPARSSGESMKPTAEGSTLSSFRELIFTSSSLRILSCSHS